MTNRDRFLRFLGDSGLNQSDAARHLKCSPQFVSYLVNGSKLPSLRMAFAIEDWSGAAVPARGWLNGHDAE